MNPLTKARNRMPFRVRCTAIALITFSALYSQQPSDANHRDKVASAMRAWKEAKSFRARIEWVYGSLKHTSESEVVHPDREHTKDKNKETINIGKSHYERNGDGPWKKIVYTEDFSRFGPPDTDGYAILSGVKEINFIGQETLDDIPVLAYQLVPRDASGKGTMSVRKIWIGVNDGLPHRIEHEFDFNPGDLGVNREPGLNPGKGKLIFTLYDFNAEIKIEPPTIDNSVHGTAIGTEGPPHTGTEAGPGVGGGAGRAERSPTGGDRNADGSAKVVDTRPVLISSPRPFYTRKARDNKVEGSIRARVLVSEGGSVKSVRLITHLPDGLDNQAIIAAYQMRFKPAMRDGKRVAFWVPIEIEFNLK